MPQAQMEILKAFFLFSNIQYMAIIFQTFWESNGKLVNAFHTNDTTGSFFYQAIKKMTKKLWDIK